MEKVVRVKSSWCKTLKPLRYTALSTFMHLKINHVLNMIISNDFMKTVGSMTAKINAASSL